MKHRRELNIHTGRKIVLGVGIVTGAPIFALANSAPILWAMWGAITASVITAFALAVWDD